MSADYKYHSKINLFYLFIEFYTRVHMIKKGDILTDNYFGFAYKLTKITSNIQFFFLAKISTILPQRIQLNIIVKP